MAPVPTGTASCMACARKRTSGAACASVSTPEATSAEYSPSEWPATTDGRRAAFGAPGAVGGHTRDQHHRLGIGGQAQRFLGALPDQPRQVLAQGIGGFLQRLGHGRVIAPGIEHADGLRALARKDECERFHARFQQ